MPLFLQSMFGDWEKFKVAVESSRQPELMLIVDKWQQLQFVSRDYFAKYAFVMYFDLANSSRLQTCVLFRQIAER